MADVGFRRIKRRPTNEDIVEYLDYLCDRLGIILENIDEENLTDKMKNKIGG